MKRYAVLRSGKIVAHSDGKYVLYVEAKSAVECTRQEGVELASRSAKVARIEAMDDALAFARRAVEIAYTRGRADEFYDRPVDGPALFDEVLAQADEDTVRLALEFAVGQYT